MPRRADTAADAMGAPGRTLSDVTVDDVWTEFLAGDPALRQVFRQWRTEEPDLAPASFAADLERWRGVHAGALGRPVLLHRAVLVAPSHWAAEGGAPVAVGRHWSLDEDKAYVMGGGAPVGSREYLVTTQVDLAQEGLVDWPATLAANIAFGEQEHEVVLRPDCGLRLVRIRGLDGGGEIAPVPAVTGPAPASPPPFAPAIGRDAGGTFYDDGVVRGAVDEYDADGRRGLVIHEWNSADPGKGHAARALAWLRERYEVIVANGVGSLDDAGVGDIATAYWEHMRDKGLVDVLLLDDGTELSRDAAPHP